MYTTTTLIPDDDHLLGVGLNLMEATDYRPAKVVVSLYRRNMGGEIIMHLTREQIAQLRDQLNRALDLLVTNAR